MQCQQNSDKFTELDKSFLKKPAPQVDPSIDFISCARWLLKFLDVVDSRKDLAKKDVMERVMEKYLKWMWIKKQHPDEFILPDVEVEATWQSHLIRNDYYREDCIHMFGDVIPHHIELDEEKIKQGRQRTKELWQQTYNEKEEDALLDTRTPLPHAVARKLPLDLTLKIEDVIEDRNWIGYFKIYCGNALTDNLNKFLEKSVQDYHRFLRVCRDYREICDASPVYPVDLCWHIHQLHPVLYHKDSHFNNGYFLAHEPWPKTKRGKNMVEDLTQVDKLWNELWGESIHNVRDTCVSSKTAVEAS